MKFQIEGGIDPDFHIPKARDQSDPPPIGTIVSWPATSRDGRTYARVIDPSDKEYTTLAFVDEGDTQEFRTNTLNERIHKRSIIIEQPEKVIKLLMDAMDSIGDEEASALLVRALTYFTGPS